MAKEKVLKPPKQTVLSTKLLTQIGKEAFRAFCIVGMKMPPPMAYRSDLTGMHTWFRERREEFEKVDLDKHDWTGIMPATVAFIYDLQRYSCGDGPVPVFHAEMPEGDIPPITYDNRPIWERFHEEDEEDADVDDDEADEEEPAEKNEETTNTEPEREEESMSDQSRFRAAVTSKATETVTTEKAAETAPAATTKPAVTSRFAAAKQKAETPAAKAETPAATPEVKKTEKPVVAAVEAPAPEVAPMPAAVVPTGSVSLDDVFGALKAINGRLDTIEKQQELLGVALTKQFESDDIATTAFRQNLHNQVEDVGTDVAALYTGLVFLLNSIGLHDPKLKSVGRLETLPVPNDKKAGEVEKAEQEESPQHHPTASLVLIGNALAYLANHIPVVGRDEDHVETLADLPVAAEGQWVPADAPAAAE